MMNKLETKERWEGCPGKFDINNPVCLDHGESDDEEYWRCNPALKNMVQSEQNSVPDFSAEEINLLSSLSEESNYYKKSYEFVHNTVLNSEFEVDSLGEEQMRWLWRIKRDLEEQLEGNK